MHKVVNYNQDTRPSVEFITGARFFAAAKGSPTNAALLAEESGRATPRTVEWLKSAVSPGTLGDAQSGGNLALHQSLAAAYLDSVAPFSAFDTIPAAAKKVALLTTVASVSLGAVGHAADEGAYKRISRLQVDVNNQMAPRKASTILVFSNDAWRSFAPGAQELIRREAQLGTARTTDEVLIDVVSDAAAPVASIGSDVGAVYGDIAAALEAVEIGRNSRLFLIMHPDNTKALATMAGDNGRAFPDMDVLIGKVCGINVIAADTIASDEVILLDASSLAVNPGTVLLHVASSAALRMSDDPDNDAALTDLWGKNLLGLRLERNFGCEVIHSAAAALISGANYSGVTA